jgi:WD40 repeat protein
VIKLWDVAMGQLVLTFKRHAGSVCSIACSRDGTRAVSGGSGDKTVKLCDVSTGRPCTLFSTQKGFSVSFSPDGARVVPGGADKILRVRDATTGRMVRSFEAHSSAITSVAFSPEGARLCWPECINNRIRKSAKMASYVVKEKADSAQIRECVS